MKILKNPGRVGTVCCMVYSLLFGLKASKGSVLREENAVKYFYKHVDYENFFDRLVNFNLEMAFATVE